MIYEKLLASVEAIRRHHNGEGSLKTTIVRPPDVALDVAAIRAKTGLSQTDFACVFGLTLAALKNWEQGSRIPRGAVRTYLQLVDRDPEGVANRVRESLLAMPGRG